MITCFYLNFYFLHKTLNFILACPLIIAPKHDFSLYNTDQHQAISSRPFRI